MNNEYIRNHNNEIFNNCFNQTYQTYQTYQPEIWAMTKDSIYSAIDALMLGIENTQELLIKHDIELGRTTRSNKLTAERLEQ